MTCDRLTSAVKLVHRIDDKISNPMRLIDLFIESSYALLKVYALVADQWVREVKGTWLTGSSVVVSDTYIQELASLWTYSSHNPS